MEKEDWEVEFEKYFSGLIKYGYGNEDRNVSETVKQFITDLLAQEKIRLFEALPEEKDIIPNPKGDEAIGRYNSIHYEWNSCLQTIKDNLK
jgi:hypothetical protein